MKISLQYATGIFHPECTMHSTLESLSHGHENSRSNDRLYSWLGIRDGNITFEDSLDFDISEIESVYEDQEGDR